MLAMCTDVMGPDHPETLAATRKLGMALWRAGYNDQAISVLDQALSGMTPTLERDHPERIELLCTLGEILLEQRLPEQCEAIFREIVECCTRRGGENHPSALAAKGDLAIVFFELGKEREAATLEQEAAESAPTHLGTSHPVSCVLAWNRALRHRKCGDPSSARRIVISELVWLLAEEASSLGPDQNSIRTMLAEELNWDTAPEV
jgi:hypothetical protein